MRNTNISMDSKNKTPPSNFREPVLKLKVEITLE